MPNQFHQPAHTLFAARTERRDNFVIAQPSRERLIRHREFSGVHTQAGESPTWPQYAECTFESALSSQRLNSHIDAPSASEVLDTLHDIFFGEIEHNVRTHAFCHLATKRVRLDRDDQARAPQFCSSR